jgi:hypothetical protein
LEAVEIAGLLLLVCCALLLGLVVRRRVLDRAGGTIDMSLRRNQPGHDPHGSLHWSFGVGRYDGDRLVWFKTFSLAPKPRFVIERAALTVRQRRTPHGAEALAVIANADVLECEYGDSIVEIAVPSSAVPGLLAWLEAAPRRTLV